MRETDDERESQETTGRRKVRSKFSLIAFPSDSAYHLNSFISTSFLLGLFVCWFVLLFFFFQQSELRVGSTPTSNVINRAWATIGLDGNHWGELKLKVKFIATMVDDVYKKSLERALLDKTLHFCFMKLKILILFSDCSFCCCCC